MTEDRTRGGGNESDAGAESTASDIDAETADAVTPVELYERVRAGERVRIVDLRNRDEFETWRVSGPGVEAAQVPATKFVQARVTGAVDEIADGLVADFDASDDPLIVVCARGEASADAAADLREAGVDAVTLAGGMEGWARVYVAEALTGVADPTADAEDTAADAGAVDAGGATVLQYRRPSSGCLAYLVVAGDEAAVIDPLRAFADRYVADAEARGATLRYAIDTHVHADHVSGIRGVAGRSGAEAVLPEGARERGLDFDARLVADGEVLPVGDAALTALQAPGHTTEMTAYRLGDVLFGGDLLFPGSVARPDLERGDEGAADMARRLHRTLRERVLELPDETLIAPGHHGESATPAEDGTYTASIGALRDRLAALSMNEDEFVEYAVGHLPPRPANFESIIATNLGRRDASDDEAFEWELGPNNCATAQTD